MVNFELITTGGVKHRESVYEVILPTPDGIIAVFKNHSSLVSITSNGVISLRRQQDHSNDMLVSYAVNANGVIEILNDTVKVLVDEAVHSQEIDEAASKQALEQAKLLIKEAKDKQSLDEAIASIDRHTVRLKLAELKRKKH